MNKENLHDFVQAVEEEKLNVHAIAVEREGVLLGEQRWVPDEPHYLASATKSFTSIAVGIAIEEGRLGLNDKVMLFFPQELPRNVPEQLEKLTVRHLLMMSSGHSQVLLMRSDCVNRRVEDQNWARYFLQGEFCRNPGESFFYEGGCSYMLSVILTKATGESLDCFLRKRLFQPLDMSPVWMEFCPMGFAIGGYGLSMRTLDLLRFGSLCLRGGLWNGKQLVPKSWICEATRKQIDSNGSPDWNLGYGYQFWLGRNDSFRADGSGGQFSIAIPKYDMVIAIQANESNDGGTQKILDVVWRTMIPECDRI